MPPVGRKSLEPYLSDDVHYYVHQIEGIRWMAKRRNFLLADEMGTGKSLQALTCFIVDVKREWAETCVVVCPVSLKGNWEEEVRKFTTIPVTVLSGGPMERLYTLANFQAAKGPRILVANYEQVLEYTDTFNALNIDVLILDEAHTIKNHKSKRTQAILGLVSHRTFLLTGTPMLNAISELWPLLHRIDSKAFPDYYKFTNRYAVWGGYKSKSVIATKNETELTERLQAVMIRRLKKDVLDLPEVNEVDRLVDLYEEQRKIYDTINDDLILPRADAPDEAIEYAFTKMLRLKQICGGTWDFTGEDISAKLDAALVDDFNLFESAEKVVVFTQFRSVQARYIERLKKSLPDVPVFELNGDVKISDRVPLTHRWAGVTGASVLVCMYQVAGVGLNLTASKNVSLLDELFVPGLNQQAVDRCHRIGADLTQPVTVRRYMCRNTYESRIRSILKTKSRLISGIVETDRDWKRKLMDALREDE